MRVLLAVMFLWSLSLFAKTDGVKSVKILGMEAESQAEWVANDILSALKKGKEDKYTALMKQYDLKLDTSLTSDAELVLRQLQASDQDEALFSAVSSNDIESVKSILAKGSVNADVLHQSWTPLVVASYHGYEEIAKMLIAYGADLNKVDALTGTMPIIHAIGQGQIGIVKMLVEAGVNLEEKVQNGQKTALFYAADVEENLEITKYLLSVGADANAVDGIGRTALMKALWRKGEEKHTDKNRAIIYALLEKTDVNPWTRAYKQFDWKTRKYKKKKVSPMSALVIALYFNRSDAVIDALYKHGAVAGESDEQLLIFATACQGKWSTQNSAGDKIGAMKTCDRLIKELKDSENAKLESFVFAALGTKYELSLITGKKFSKEDKRLFSEKAQKNKRGMQVLEMLQILENAVAQNQDAEIALWTKKYGFAGMKGWSFKDLRAWSATLEISTRQRVQKYVDIFEGVRWRDQSLRYEQQ